MDQSFTCHKCKQQKSAPKDSCGTGYASDKDNNKICYDCCGEIDRKEMIEMDGKKRIPLYLVEEKVGNGTIRKVTNWPNTLTFKVFASKKGRHNIGGTRTDVWFAGPDGFIWHGIQIGENNQVCRCKRTKEKSRVAA